MSRAAARLVVVLLGVLATLAVAGPASAHVGGGAAGSDFDGRVTAVRPELPGVTVRVLQFGDDLELVNRSGTEVVVPGYRGRALPPHRPGRRLAQPAQPGDLHQPRPVRPDHPAREGRPAGRAGVGATVHRAALRLARPPHALDDPGPAAAGGRGRPEPQPHRLRVAGAAALRRHRGAVDGVLTWTPPPSPVLVWPLYVATALLAAAAGLLARTARPLGALLLVGAAAALWHAGATPVPAVSVSSHTGAILAALLPALTAALVAGIGFRASRRGRGVMTGLFAAVLGWLLLVQGLPDVDVLWSANVLTNGPQAVGRVAVALLLALGPGFVVGGIAAVRRFREVTVPDGAGDAGRVALIHLGRSAPVTQATAASDGPGHRVGGEDVGEPVVADVEPAQTHEQGARARRRRGRRSAGRGGASRATRSGRGRPRAPR